MFTSYLHIDCVVCVCVSVPSFHCLKWPFFSRVSSFICMFKTDATLFYLSLSFPYSLTQPRHPFFMNKFLPNIHLCPWTFFAFSFDKSEKLFNHEWCYSLSFHLILTAFYLHNDANNCKQPNIKERKQNILKKWKREKEKNCSQKQQQQQLRRKNFAKLISTRIDNAECVWVCAWSNEFIHMITINCSKWSLVIQPISFLIFSML